MWQIGLAYLVAVFLAVVGWGMNIYKLITHINDIGNLEIVRIIGIPVAPLGVVMGWFV